MFTSTVQSIIEWCLIKITDEVWINPKDISYIERYAEKTFIHLRNDPNREIVVDLSIPEVIEVLNDSAKRLEDKYSDR